jgi:two-component system, NarL family, response regulator DevR
MKRAPRKKVLLVDDSRLVRQRLQALIGDLPDVQIVGNAGRVTEAIRKIRDLRPQIVVLDIALLDGNGLQVLEAIRKFRRALPRIIMLTNFSHEAYRDKCLKLGAEYFFDKSAQFEQAVDVIRELSRVQVDGAGPKPARNRRGRKATKERPPISRPSSRPSLSALCTLGAFAAYSLIASGHAAPVFNFASLVSPSGHG